MSLLRAEGFSCSLDVFQGGLGIKKLKFFVPLLTFFNNIASLKSFIYVESEVILHATWFVFCNDAEKTKTKVRVDGAVSLPIGDLRVCSQPYPCLQPLGIHVHIQ
jgi:hypothetical protein